MNCHTNIFIVKSNSFLQIVHNFITIISDTFSETAVNVADSTTILSYESTNVQEKDDDIHSRTINFFSTKTFKTSSTPSISTTTTATLFKFTTKKIVTMDNFFMTKKYNTIEFSPITISSDNVNTIETDYQKSMYFYYFKRYR